jgi:hypothetical protein
MSMLDDETLKEFGRFAVEFSTLDELITNFAAAILECVEWEIAEHLTAKLSLGSKLDLIGAVSKTLAKKYALTQPYDVLSRQIISAKRLIGDRNTVVHGSLTIKRGERPIVQARGRRVEMTSDKLSELVRQIDRATDGLPTAYFDFMDAVCNARATAA